MVVYVEQGVKTIYQSSMFKCKECDSTEFNLMLQPGFAGKVDITVNDDHEVVIQVNGKEFIADLMFMNQFAVCKCGEIKTWEYFYPNRPNSKVESAPVEE